MTASRSRSAAKTGKARAKRARPGLRGAFITLEGIDGCGKSTQAKRLAERLEQAGYDVVLTREPGGTPIGKALREVLLHPGNTAMAPESELLVFLADRIQHLRELIRPALKRKAVVICDRFHDATVAYQRHARGIDFAPLRALIASHIRPMPDTTLWLDVDVDLALARLRERDGGTQGATRLDREPVAFHKRVRRGYQTIAKAEPKRVLRIDASRPMDAVAEDIWARLSTRYKL